MFIKSYPISLHFNVELQEDDRGDPTRRRAIERLSLYTRDGVLEPDCIVDRA
jgi:hypothetical protein